MSLTLHTVPEEVLRTGKMVWRQEESEEEGAQLSATS